MYFLKLFSTSRFGGEMLKGMHLYLLVVNYTCWKPFGSQNTITINKHLIAKTVTFQIFPECFQHTRPF